MPTEEREQRISGVARRRQQGAIVLEDIHNQNNAKAVFRTADALGFQHVCLVFEQNKPFDPTSKHWQTSCSAHKWLSFSIFHSMQECADELRESGHTLVATVPDQSADSIFEANLLHPRTALFLGNEYRGLSAKAVELADQRMTIPMAGMVQSLNLSVTAAVCLFEITRQRMADGIEKYQLDGSQRELLEEEFWSR